MPTVHINMLAVLVAGVISMIIGSLWYSPLLFGKKWIALMGWTPEAMEKAKKQGMASAYILMFVGSLVMSYVLAHIIAYTNATTFGTGMQGGFWMWLGFVATVSLSSVLFEKKSWSLWLLNNGYHLVQMLLIGGMLAVWK